MKKGSISLDEYMKATKQYEKLLKEANDLLRSVYAISEREGTETNWKALRKKVKNILSEMPLFGIVLPSGE